MSSYTFDEITEDGRLWAVRNEHSEDNVLSELFDFWNDEMNTAEKLKQFRSSTPSHWREEAQARQTNKSWLRYSQHIAMMMLEKMQNMHMSQASLASIMGCSPQYISKVLKGKENLSIETMYKIECALHIVILPQEIEGAKIA
jgi:antitoxin component HigA of HigAB toxin-antitoxin module